MQILQLHHLIQSRLVHRSTFLTFLKTISSSLAILSWISFKMAEASWQTVKGGKAVKKDSAKKKKKREQSFKPVLLHDARKWMTIWTIAALLTIFNKFIFSWFNSVSYNRMHWLMGLDSGVVIHASNFHSFFRFRHSLSRLFLLHVL